jgi:hypothetical protein
VVGPGGISLQKTFIDAAVAAGVSRFIIDDFGWGPTTKGFAEFGAIHAARREGWDYAARKAQEVQGFTWTGLSTGNPIDWVSQHYFFGQSLVQEDFMHFIRRESDVEGNRQ